VSFRPAASVLECVCAPAPRVSVRPQGVGFDDSVPWFTKTPATRAPAGRSRWHLPKWTVVGRLSEIMAGRGAGEPGEEPAAAVAREEPAEEPATVA
jgi:hypothetical protein